jgi:hypothetical protein
MSSEYLPQLVFKIELSLQAERPDGVPSFGGVSFSVEWIEVGVVLIVGKPGTAAWREKVSVNDNVYSLVSSISSDS